MSSQLHLISRFTKFNYVPRRGFSSQLQNKDQPTQPSSSSLKAPKESVQVSSFRKRLFVSVGLYKSVKDIPDSVSSTTMARNMDRFRVRASIVLMAVCALGAVSSIFLAKDVVDSLEDSRGRDVSK